MTMTVLVIAGSVFLVAAIVVGFFALMGAISKRPRSSTSRCAGSDGGSWMPGIWVSDGNGRCDSSPDGSSGGGGCDGGGGGGGGDGGGGGGGGGD